MPELGCGETQAFIVSNCLAGGSNNTQLADAKEIEWTRKVNDISDAKVVIAVTGDSECCEYLQDVYPWCSYLRIVRDGVIVWEGPITNVIFRTDEVEIEAMDPLAWLLVRIPPKTFVNNVASGLPAMWITDIAKIVLEAAFSEHDPCVLDYVTQTDITLGLRSGSPVTRIGTDKLPAFSGTYADWLVTLSESGLDYTVVAGQVFLSLNKPALGVLGTLRDSHIIGDIEVHRDGFVQANRVWVRFVEDDDAVNCENLCGDDCSLCTESPVDGGCFTVPCPVLKQADNFYCFGPIEKLLENTADADYDSAAQNGEDYIRDAAVTPTQVILPEGATLSPDAPFEINDLFPGVQINIAITDLCFPVSNAFQLREVTFRLDDNNHEEIQVTLGELNSISGLN